MGVGGEPFKLEQIAVSRERHGRFDEEDLVYMGESAGFLPHGRGKMEWPDTSSYEGEWACGL
eukprot:1503288-Rhodomonas_salina.1